ncbi:hypothetical protein IMSAGC008_00247 [Muribaculaceae bacterium]|nr:hypothetical protein IMSAGC008_00247 [Muribaculaceae bacterium]
MYDLLIRRGAALSGGSALFLNVFNINAVSINSTFASYMLLIEKKHIPIII